MVSAHVFPDRDDHQIVGLAVSHVPAFAADDSGHFVLLSWCTPTVLPQCWHDVGVADRDEDPALRVARDRAGRCAPGGPYRGTAERYAVRLPDNQSSPPKQARRARTGAVGRRIGAPQG